MGEVKGRFGIVTILIALSFLVLATRADCQFEGTCSYNLTNQQSCHFIAGIANAESHVMAVETYGMIKSIYQRVVRDVRTAYSQSTSYQQAGETEQSDWTNEYLSDSVRSGRQDGTDAPCQGTSDEDLWEMIQDRSNKRKRQIKDLLKTSVHLQSKYEGVSKINVEQLSSLRRLKLQLQSYQLLQRQLLANATELRKNLEATELARDMSNKQLKKVQMDLSALRMQHAECERQFNGVKTALSQVPELASPKNNNYQLMSIASDGEPSISANFVLLDWQHRIRDFTNKLSSQEDTVDSLKRELRAALAENKRLKADLSVRNSEFKKKYSSCTKDMSEWKNKFHRKMEKYTAIRSSCEQSDFCFTGESANFCGLEVADPSHTETCWFERLSSADFYWRVVSNRQLSRHQRHKAITDHTCGSSQGRFLFLDLSPLTIGQQARLTSMSLYSEAKQCFSFWYKVDYVFNYGKFYIMVMMNSRRSSRFGNILQVWNQNTVRQGEWQYAKFEIPAHVANNGYKIQFIAESNGPGYIALDDLAFISGSCLK